MRIVFIADARSTISQGWIRYFIDRGHDVYVISSYPCSSQTIAGAKISEVPIAFSRFSEVGHNGKRSHGANTSPWTATLASLRVGSLSSISASLRLWLGPIELNRYVQTVRKLLADISPELVHAMRIPFEGILAAKATPSKLRLIVSVWGNDFTLCAASNPLVARQTSRALGRVDGLLCDCHRDLGLAVDRWGFSSDKPAAVLPSAGGVRLKVPSEESLSRVREQLNIPDGSSVVLNPRGFRTYVRNDVFFQSIPLVLKECPRTVFICTGMESNPIAEKWVRGMSIGESVRLLPVVEHERMADLFALADVSVSPSLHDGTPNSLLEAMACGCFPVAGDIESVREWIVGDENGLLCDPRKPDSVAKALLRGLDDHELRERAKKINRRLVTERAEYEDVMQRAEEFYHRVIKRVDSTN